MLKFKTLKTIYNHDIKFIIFQDINNLLFNRSLSFLSIVVEGKGETQMHMNVNCALLNNRNLKVFKTLG